jgi:hypothetical protein
MLAPMSATVAAHADWSVDSRKRWISIARRQDAGWQVAAPAPVGDVATLLARLLAAAGGGAVALGVDLPLGLPRGYARRHANDPDFYAFLHGLARRPGFFRVCATLDDITPDRPFYPARGLRGMTRAAHAAALGLDCSGNLGSGYLVPFYNNKIRAMEATFIPGYRGLLDLARRSGEIEDIFAECVYESDEFDYELGATPRLRHVPKDFELLAHRRVGFLQSRQHLSPSFLRCRQIHLGDGID